MRQVPDVIKQFIANKYGSKPVRIESTPYWSTCRLAASTAGLCAIQRVQAFSYGIGSDMALAGRTGVLATLADTNLMKPGETRQNADVFVMGVAAYPTQDSEPALLAKLFREAALELSTDGVNTNPLGTLEMFPAGGGIQGIGRSYIKTPALQSQGAKDGGEGGSIPFANNGNAMAGNFFELAAPILWAGQTGVDSNFRLILSTGRAFTEVVGATRAAIADVATINGVAAYTSPAAAGDDGTFVDIRFRLACWSVSLRSQNG